MCYEAPAERVGAVLLGYAAARSAGPRPMPIPTTETEALVRAAKQGDRIRLGEVYERAAPALYAWASLRVRTRFRHHLQVEDLVQEIWLRALSLIDTFPDSHCSFRAWLFRVAKNVLHEVQRKLFKTQPESHGGGSSTKHFALAQVPLEVTTVTRRVARDEGLQRFLERVAELDEVDRKLVVHCGLEELEKKEVARMLDLGVEAVFKRWQRLRAKMGEWNVAKDLVADA